MLLLLQRCVSLSLWVTCYCLCGLVMPFIFPPDSCCKHKDHLQKNNKLKSFKKPTDTSICASFIYYMAIKQKVNESLRNLKQINVVCVISHAARGGRRNCSSKASVCGRSFSSRLASLHMWNYWIRLKVVLVMFSQTERFNQRYCNHRDAFHSNQAA